MRSLLLLQVFPYFDKVVLLEKGAAEVKGGSSNAAVVVYSGPPQHGRSILEGYGFDLPDEYDSPPARGRDSMGSGC